MDENYDCNMIDHARNLVIFLEYGSIHKNILDNCLRIFIHIYYKKYKSHIIKENPNYICKDSNCLVCGNFHKNYKDFNDEIKYNSYGLYENNCPCNQYEGNCIDCMGNTLCNRIKSRCYLTIDEQKLNREIWKKELLKLTWIKIEEILGDELYDLPKTITDKMEYF